MSTPSSSSNAALWLTQLRALRAIALDRTLSSTSKAVFATLMKRHNRRTGQCNPSLRRIAEDVGRSEREVRRRAIPQLVAAGAVVVVRSGRGRSHQYAICFEHLVERDAAHDLAIGLRKPEAVSNSREPHPEASADPSDADPGPNAPTRPGPDGPLNQTEVELEGKNPADRSASPLTSPATLKRALDIYNETAAKVGWPKASKLTQKRANALRARLSDSQGLAGWRTVLERASRSRFLRGEARSRGAGSGWQCNLDFLIDDHNFVRLQEGAYDDRSVSTKSQGPGVFNGSPTLAAIRRLREGEAL